VGPTSNNALKKALKKSSLKTIKKKAAKESFGGPVEDTEAINK
jgi:hypothetical protein